VRRGPLSQRANRSSMCYMFVDYSLCLSGTELPVLLSASVLLGLVLAQNIRERLMTNHHRRTATC
jgi:hypothetical protein